MSGRWRGTADPMRNTPRRGGLPRSDPQQAGTRRRLGWIAGMTPAQRRAVVAANLRVASGDSRARAERVQQTLLPDLTLAQSAQLSPSEYLLYIDLATELRIAALVATLPTLGDSRLIHLGTCTGREEEEARSFDPLLDSDGLE